MKDPKMNIIELCSNLNSQRFDFVGSFKGFMAHFADRIIRKLEQTEIPSPWALGLTHNGVADDSYRPSAGKVTGLIYTNRERLKASEEKFIASRDRLRDEQKAADALELTHRAEADVEMDVENSSEANTSADSRYADRTGRQ